MFLNTVPSFCVIDGYQYRCIRPGVHSQLILFCVHLCVCVVLSVEHSELGLETRRRRSLLSRVEAWFHRSKLPRTWLLYAHVKPIHHALILAGQLTRHIVLLNNK